MNNQWKLTANAIIHTNPDYRIGIDQLLETRSSNGIQVAMWPLQIAEKSWADVEDFIPVFRTAIERFEEKQIAELNLSISLAMAREIAFKRSLK